MRDSCHTCRSPGIGIESQNIRQSIRRQAEANASADSNRVTLTLRATFRNIFLRESIALGLPAGVAKMDASLLDSLPPDAIPNILRLLSERPLAKNWPSYLRISDVFDTFMRLRDADGVLSEACRRIFSRITCRGHRRHEDPVDSCLNIYDRCYKLEKNLEELMLRGRARCITELAWQSFFLDGVELSSLEKHCAHIKELGLCFGTDDEACGSDYKPLIRSVSGHLTSLVCDGELEKEDTDVIVQHCKLLSKLELELPDHDLGPGLEHHGLLDIIKTPDKLTCVEKYCRNLVSLKLG